MSREEELPPNYGKLDVALRSIGYSFEAAVADVIDNSIDATAQNVLVRLITKGNGHLDLVIYDDGKGMASEKLKEAMRFGADVSEEIKRLGKFGLGLKLASLSQARELRVVTLKHGVVSGRAWLEHGISKGFTSTVFDTAESNQIVSRVIPGRQLEPHCTVVWWTDLYRVGQDHVNPEEHAQKLMQRIQNYVSIGFHRFLSRSPTPVRITLDMLDLESGASGIPIDIDPLDPFDYDQSGNSAFPAAMFLDGEYEGRISIKAHIWPPNSSSPSYKLPGGTNSRQGFYFYRNDRLIQGGGWNGLRETEPHSSLARLEIDIASDFDVEVSLDVKKVEIQLPPSLAESIQKAKTIQGIDFKKYLSIADNTYRTRKILEKELPLIPSLGLPAELRTFLHRELRIKSTAKHRDLKIKWKRLSKELFFEIDRDAGELYINKEYRKQLLHGFPASSADIPVVKCLLFMVLEDALSYERIGSKLRERLEQVNRILVQAVRYERSLR
jgi:hypothetical protein